MFSLLAFVLLGVVGAIHAAAFIAARRAVTRRVPERVQQRRFGFVAGRTLAGFAGWYFASGVLIAIGMFGRGELVLDETSMRVDVAAGGPAARAGIERGDRILTVSGAAVATWDDLKRSVAATGGQPFPVGLERAGRPMTVTVTAEGAPAKMRVGPLSEQRSLGPLGAIAGGFAAPAKIAATTAKGLRRLVAGSESATMTGPVGIVKETSSAAKQGLWGALLLVTAIFAYILPGVLFGSALYELLHRRHP